MPLLKRYKFYFRPGLSLAAAITFGILLGLGAWQLERLAWKEALIRQVSERVHALPVALDTVLERRAGGQDQTYQPVFLTGVFHHEYDAHVFGLYDGRPGWFVFTPLEVVRKGDHPEPFYIYINRGFVTEDKKDHYGRGGANGGSGVANITGLFRETLARPAIAAFFQPPNRPDKNEWYERSPHLWADHIGIEAADFVVDGFKTGVPNAPLGGTTRLEFNNRHKEYALTWFGLAGSLGIIYLAVCFRRVEVLP